MPTPFVARIRYIIVNNDYGLGRKQAIINPTFHDSTVTDKGVGGGARDVGLQEVFLLRICKN